MSATFLAEEDVAILTGRKVKTKQIEALRKMGLPFFVNAVGKPVVTVAAVEGKREKAKNEPKWSPAPG